MPFRCKCGRTFEKLDTFGSHTSGCALFHHRRTSSSDLLTTASPTEHQQKKRLSIQTSELFNNQRFILMSPTKSDFPTSTSSPSSPKSATAYDSFRGFMMPTALSIQNTFEGVNRRRSMSTAEVIDATTVNAAKP